MDQIPTPYLDRRHAGRCVYCGGPPDTRDHVPPRALLDEPFPANLFVVESCDPCNGGASKDEQYFACLIEVVIAGSADPAVIGRDRVRRALDRDPALRSMLGASVTTVDERTWIAPDAERVERVLTKCGRALWAFEVGEPTAGMSATCTFAALEEMPDRDRFLEPPASDLWPEIGSRMFMAAAERGSAGWQVVQAGRFAYVIDVSEGTVRMIVRDYLAAEVTIG